MSSDLMFAEACARALGLEAVEARAERAEQAADQLLAAQLLRASSLTDQPRHVEAALSSRALKLLRHEDSAVAYKLQLTIAPRLLLLAPDSEERRSIEDQGQAVSQRLREMGGASTLVSRFEFVAEFYRACRLLGLMGTGRVDGHVIGPEDLDQGRRHLIQMWRSRIEQAQIASSVQRLVILAFGSSMLCFLIQGHGKFMADSGALDDLSFPDLFIEVLQAHRARDPIWREHNLMETDPVLGAYGVPALVLYWGHIGTAMRWVHHVATSAKHLQASDTAYLFRYALPFVSLQEWSRRGASHVWQGVHMQTWGAPAITALIQRFPPSMNSGGPSGQLLTLRLALFLCRGSAAVDSLDQVREVIADGEEVLAASDLFPVLLTSWGAPVLLAALTAEEIGDDQRANAYAERFLQRYDHACFGYGIRCLMLALRGRVAARAGDHAAAAASCRALADTAIAERLPFLAFALEPGDDIEQSTSLAACEAMGRPYDVLRRELAEAERLGWADRRTSLT